MVALFGIVSIEGGGDASFGVVGPQFVPRDLLLHEAVVRLACVKRIDHVVAVPPRVRTRHVRLETVALRESSQVQPMPPPALPVVRGGQQALDNALESIG